MRTDCVTFFVIYHRPRDLPGVPYAVRPTYVGGGQPMRQGSIACLCDSLAQARQPLYATGCIRLTRDPADDPVIVESWLA